MTTYEVARTLFWIVAGSYAFYLTWTIRRVLASRSARRRHPTARNPRRAARNPTADNCEIPNGAGGGI